MLTSLCVRVMCVVSQLKQRIHTHTHIYIDIYKLVHPNVQDMVTALYQGSRFYSSHIQLYRI